MTSSTDSEARLLTDDEVRRFIVDGFLVRQVDELDPSFHQELYHRARERRPSSLLSDEVDACMPELHAVLNGPTVCGALQSILEAAVIHRPAGSAASHRTRRSARRGRRSCCTPPVSRRSG